ncbi:serine-threonine protein kinase, partial [mine drainage metagenome]
IVAHSDTSLCHGIAGLGEIYLEAYRTFNEDRWLKKAMGIAEVLLALGNAKGTRSIEWIIGDLNYPIADLMVGSGSIVHFFLNLRTKGRVGFPLLVKN